MNNEMISQLQFDRIKKEIQARAIGNYSKKRISNMTASTNLQTVLDRQEETREAITKKQTLSDEIDVAISQALTEYDTTFRELVDK